MGWGTQGPRHEGPAVLVTSQNLFLCPVTQTDQQYHLHSPHLLVARLGPRMRPLQSWGHCFHVEKALLEAKVLPHVGSLSGISQVLHIGSPCSCPADTLSNRPLAQWACGGADSWRKSCPFALDVRTGVVR